MAGLEDRLAGSGWPAGAGVLHHEADGPLSDSTARRTDVWAWLVAFSTSGARIWVTSSAGAVTWIGSSGASTFMSTRPAVSRSAAELPWATAASVGTISA
jgi:hypothetical protein